MTCFWRGCALACALLPTAFAGAATNAVAAAAAAPDAADEAAAPSDGGFARYRTIIDRKPFGPEPANFNPDTPGARGGGAGAGAADPAAQEAAKTQEEQRILASVRVSALNVTPSGKIAVGFTDASKAPAGNYYLKVGETRDGWTVKAADARAMKVTLEKDGVEATLGLGEGSGGAGKDGKTGAPRASARPPVARLARAGLLRAAAPAVQTQAAPPAAPGGGSLANLRLRRAQKDAERRAEAERQAAAAEAERAAREKAEAERRQEREQQREQLLQIQEELRRAREQREQEQRRQQEEAAAGEAEATGEETGG